MIRRWSSITDINIFFRNYFKVKRKFLLIFAKNTVSFKKFKYKWTKFNRKKLFKIKHKNNWLIYSQIFKYWINDFRFFKVYYRNQFFNKLLINNFLVYNFNFIKKESNKLVNKNCNFYINLITKKYFNYFFKNSINDKLLRNFFFFKNFFINFIFFYNLNKNELKFDSHFDTNIIPIYSYYENNLYVIKSLNNEDFIFDLSICFNFYEKLIINSIVELYKINIILYINILLK